MSTKNPHAGRARAHSKAKSALIKAFPVEFNEFYMEELEKEGISTSSSRATVHLRARISELEKQLVAEMLKSQEVFKQ
jgi:hypothetical protein